MKLCTRNERAALLLLIKGKQSIYLLIKSKAAIFIMYVFNNLNLSITIFNVTYGLYYTV